MLVLISIDEASDTMTITLPADIGAAVVELLEVINETCQELAEAESEGALI